MKIDSEVKDLRLRERIYEVLCRDEFDDYFDIDDMKKEIRKLIFLKLKYSERQKIRDSYDRIRDYMRRHIKMHTECEIRSPNCDICRNDVCDYFDIDYDETLSSFDWHGIMQQFWANKSSIEDPNGWANVICS